MSDTNTITAGSPVEARARLLKELLYAERWTGRKVALATGTNSTYIQSRLHGRVDLSFADIEAIAPLLNMSGPELFAKLQEAENAPTPEGGGASASFVHPPGLEPGTQ